MYSWYIQQNKTKIIVSRGGGSSKGSLEAGLQVRRESGNGCFDLILEDAEHLGRDRRVLLGGSYLEGGWEREGGWEGGGREGERGGRVGREGGRGEGSTCIYRGGTEGRKVKEKREEGRGGERWRDGERGVGREKQRERENAMEEKAWKRSRRGIYERTEKTGDEKKCRDRVRDRDRQKVRTNRGEREERKVRG